MLFCIVAFGIHACCEIYAIRLYNSHDNSNRENDYTGATLTETHPVIFISLRRSQMSDYLPAPQMTHYCPILTRLDA